MQEVPTCSAISGCQWSTALKAVPVVTTRTLAPWTLGLLAVSPVAMSMVKCSWDGPGPHEATEHEMSYITGNGVGGRWDKVSGLR